MVQRLRLGLNPNSYVRIWQDFAAEPPQGATWGE